MAENYKEIRTDGHSPHALQVLSDQCQLVVSEDQISTGLLIGESKVSSTPTLILTENHLTALVSQDDNEEPNGKQEEGHARNSNTFSKKLEEQVEHFTTNLQSNVLISSDQDDIINTIKESNQSHLLHEVNRSATTSTASLTLSTLDIDTNATHTIEMIAVQQSIPDHVETSQIQSSNIENFNESNIDSNLPATSSTATITGNNLLDHHHHQISEALLEAGITGSPVVINTIPLNESVGVAELNFEHPPGEDIQVVQTTEVETNVVTDNKDIAEEESHLNISENENLELNDKANEGTR